MSYFLQLMYDVICSPEVNRASIAMRCHSSQQSFFHPLQCLAFPSFFGLDGALRGSGCHQVDAPFVSPFTRCVSFNLFAMYFATPVGQASNPGPDSNEIRLAICNPTAVHKKADLLAKFEAQIIAASETSATNVIQKQVTFDMNKHGYQSFWSLPVAPKRNTIDNRPSFRGEAVGSAVFSSLPCRRMRCEIPLALRESQRFSACIVRFAMTGAGHFFIWICQQVQRR